MYYIGLDVHKRKISYCVKDSSGKVARSRGRAAIFVDQESHQLLRAVRGREELRQHRAAHALVQAAQQTFTDDLDRGGQDGTPKQPGAGHAL